MDLTDSVCDGFFGHGNVGDDAFCVVAHSMFGAGRFFVSDRRLVPALPVCWVDGATRLRRAAEVLRTRDVVHLGGSLFQRVAVRHRDQIRLARSIRGLSIGIGPFNSMADADPVGELLKRFDAVVVRDSRSAEYAADLGVPVTLGFDAAVLMLESSVPVTRPTGERAIIGVALRPYEVLRHDDATRETRREQRVVALLTELARRTPIEVRVLSFNRHPVRGDERLAERLALASEGAVIRYRGAPEQMLSAVQDCDFLIAMRLHAAIFAYLSSVPFGMICYHEKNRALVADIGLDDVLVWPSDGPTIGACDAVIGSLGKTVWQLPVPAAVDRLREALSSEVWGSSRN